MIPQKYQARMLNELHNKHPGIVRMKALSRIHVWFPGIDSHIEQTVNVVQIVKDYHVILSKLLFIRGTGLHDRLTVCTSIFWSIFWKKLSAFGGRTQ